MLRRINLRRRRTSFVRRNARLLSLFGAVIVFGTFVVRDAIRDEAKDTVEAYHVADGIFQERSDTQATLYLAYQVYDRTNQIWDRLQQDPNTQDQLRDTPIRNYLRDVAEEDDELRATLESQRNLVAMFGPHDSVRESFTSLDQRFSGLQTERQDVAKIVGNKMAPYGDTFNAVFNLWVDVQHLEGDVTQLSYRLRNHFQEQRHREERLLAIVTWSSYFLYTLGWGIAFVGRYYQRDDAENAD